MKALRYVLVLILVLSFGIALHVLAWRAMAEVWGCA